MCHFLEDNLGVREGVNLRAFQERCVCESNLPRSFCFFAKREDGYAVVARDSFRYCSEASEEGANFCQGDFNEGASGKGVRDHRNVEGESKGFCVLLRFGSVLSCYREDFYVVSLEGDRRLFKVWERQERVVSEQRAQRGEGCVFSFQRKGSEPF